jgi:long-chain acyl-CoA synthetase
MPFRPKQFSYLPLCHIAERLAIESYGLQSGGIVSFAESLDTFAANLAETQPDVFVGVPRIYGKFREGVLKKINQKKLNFLLGLPLIGKIVAKGIRKKLGLNGAKRCLTGAAPIAIELQEWFSRLGIEIIQVYGMTEDCVYAHTNSPGDNKFGSVGKPLDGLQVKFGPDGEVRVKSPGNFQGYYKEPELTAAAFDEDGFLRTGDLGEYDAEGFLHLTGRSKDQFKTDKGKYISPAPIELKLLTNPIVEQVCVVGTGIPQPICLVVPTEAGRSLPKATLVAELSSLMNTLNISLESYERLEKSVVLSQPWTIENGLMTPSMKVKRNEVEKIYLPHYPRWFEAPDKVVWDDTTNGQK